MSQYLRADHVGSLLRPKELLAARNQYFAKGLALEELRRKEDAAIERAIAMQQDTGIEVITDGEYRRATWSAAWMESVNGLSHDQTPSINHPGASTRWKGEHGAEATASMQDHVRSGSAPPPCVVTSKLSLKHRLTGHESAFLRKHARGRTKITMPGVMMAAAAWYRPQVSKSAYPTRADLVRDMVKIMRSEVEALIDEGIDYIQFDSLRYIWFMDPTLSGQMRAAGLDVEKEVQEAVAADNACVEGIERGNTLLGLHICRGNNTSAWLTEGAYDSIAEIAFSELKVDRLLLEYDTDRAGGFEPLRFVRKGVTVVLGLISSKTPQLESSDEICRRVSEAAKYVPLENLALCPQCGFASISSGNLLTWDEQRRKLELVVETARNIWS